jgi:hypothetical protein
MPEISPSALHFWRHNDELDDSAYVLSFDLEAHSTVVRLGFDLESVIERPHSKYSLVIAPNS